MFKQKRTLFILLGVLLIACCGLTAVSTLIFGGDDATPETAVDSATPIAEIAESDTETGSAETAATVEPTDSPTNTPPPTDEPTSTPEPTATTPPTATPQPSPTPRPSPTPEPIILTGSGDAIVDIEKDESPALVRISGNQGQRHFAVTNFDANGNQIDLLVNTVEPYEGVRPLDFMNGEHTTRFEVKATGNWELEIMPLGMVRRATIPGTVEGIGDDVVALMGGTPDTAHIVGNSGANHFAVRGFGGSFPDLLVNTVDPYDGMVILDSETILLEITAVGPWTIEVASR